MAIQYTDTRKLTIHGEAHEIRGARADANVWGEGGAPCEGWNTLDVDDALYEATDEALLDAVEKAYRASLDNAPDTTPVDLAVSWINGNFHHVKAEILAAAKAEPVNEDAAAAAVRLAFQVAQEMDGIDRAHLRDFLRWMIEYV